MKGCHYQPQTIANSFFAVVFFGPAPPSPTASYVEKRNTKGEDRMVNLVSKGSKEV